MSSQEFLKKEFSEENILFWQACEYFCHVPATDKKQVSPQHEAADAVRAFELWFCHYCDYLRISRSLSKAKRWVDKCDKITQSVICFNWFWLTFGTDMDKLWLSPEHLENRRRHVTSQFFTSFSAAVPESWRDLQQFFVQQGHHARQHRQPGPAGWWRPHFPTAWHVQDTTATGNNNRSELVSQDAAGDRFAHLNISVCFISLKIEAFLQYEGLWLQQGVCSHLAFSDFAQACWVPLVPIWVCLLKGSEALPQR